jgi:hypothetical protein
LTLVADEHAVSWLVNLIMIEATMSNYAGKVVAAN